MIDVASMFTPVINDVLKKIVEHGLNSRETEKELSNLRAVLREKVRREIRYNQELLDETKLDAGIRVLNMDLDALRFACEQSIPMNLLFNQQIDEAVLLKGAGESLLFRRRLLALDTETKLMERLLHRVRITKIRAKYDLPLGDLSYIRKLMRTLEVALAG